MKLNNPTVGAKGLWKLRAPYDNLLPLNTALTCTAISNYGQLINMGIDVFDTYYDKHSLNKETYESHIPDGRIIFLKTDNNKRYSFPLHYLESYPIGTGVAYASMGIGVRLGAMPVNTSIDLLIQQIEELVHLNVGVETHTEAMILSEQVIVDNAEHGRLEKVRAAKKQASTPALQRIESLTETKKQIEVKLTLAESKVIEQDAKIKELETELATLKAAPRP